MKIENQVCTVEQAIRFKELGVEQDSLFYWWTYDSGESSLITKDASCDEDLIPTRKHSAFTVAELGIMLRGISILPVWQRDYNKGRDAFAYISCTGPNQVYANAQTEAEARAQLLLHLIENREFDINDLNRMLTA